MPLRDHTERLPPDGSGFEFWAFAQPHNRWGRDAFWMPEDNGGLVWEEDGWAKMKVAISLVGQGY